MTKLASQLITIMRNVTGRVDANDPQFSDAVMLGYLNDFYRLEMADDSKLFELNDWYEFNMTIGQAEYTFDTETQNRVILRDPAYVGNFQISFYMSPQQFYDLYPQNQTYTNSRPVAVLYYNQRLLFRYPPDAAYAVRISAYRMLADLPSTASAIEYDYWFRYLAYGASIDLLNDYNEFERAQQLMGAFGRYRSLVQARTYAQMAQGRAAPNF